MSSKIDNAIASSQPPAEANSPPVAADDPSPADSAALCDLNSICSVTGQHSGSTDPEQWFDQGHQRFPAAAFAAACY